MRSTASRGVTRRQPSGGEVGSRQDPVLAWRTRGRPVMNASDLQPGDGPAPTMPGPRPVDVATIIDTLVHADDLAGRAVAAIGRGDLARAVGDFEWSLKFHVQAAIQSAERSVTAHLEGNHAHAETLATQGTMLFWHLPGRARIAAALLRAA